MNTPRDWVAEMWVKESELKQAGIWFDKFAFQAAFFEQAIAEAVGGAEGKIKQQVLAQATGVKYLLDCADELKEQSSFRNALMGLWRDLELIARFDGMPVDTPAAGEKCTSATLPQPRKGPSVELTDKTIKIIVPSGK